MKALKLRATSCGRIEGWASLLPNKVQALRFSQAGQTASRTASPPPKLRASRRPPHFKVPFSSPFSPSPTGKFPPQLRSLISILQPRAQSSENPRSYSQPPRARPLTGALTRACGFIPGAEPASCLLGWPAPGGPLTSDRPVGIITPGRRPELRLGVGSGLWTSRFTMPAAAATAMAVLR